MKLIAYKTYEYNCQKLVPASRTREWMDKTPSAFAYHCLPLVMANSLGWFVVNDIPCEMEWDGTEPASGLKVWATEELTDWLPYPFTMNWKMTAKNTRVRFERGEPIAQIIPYPADLISSVEPEILSLHNNPELYARYEDYRKKRTVFNEKFKYDGTKRQKYYVRGEDSMGNKYAEQHQTDWKTKPFVSKQ